MRSSMILLVCLLAIVSLAQGAEVPEIARYRTACIQQLTKIGRDPPGVPHMCHRGGQFDVPHPFAAHRRAGNFHATFVANDPFIADILVLAAVTLPIALWAKDRFTEEAIFLRAQTPVVDGFWF